MQNKIRKLPLLIDEQNAVAFRQKHHQLQVLTRENQASQDLISKLRQARSVNSKQTSDNLNELQERLRILATKLDNETKKNNILKELIGLTKSGITTRRKTSRVESSQQQQKKVKKEQYDLEQIQQKHNEEVAKINILKQQICFSRRERVVYSSLFKKIEKEIKIYEEKFKETLLVSKEMEEKRKRIAQDLLLRRKSTDKMQTNQSRSRIGSMCQVDDGLPKKFTELDQQQHAGPEIFITNNIQIIRRKQENFLLNQQKRSNKASQIHSSLEKYQSFFEILTTCTGQNSIESLILSIGGIEDICTNLTNEIDQVNEKVLQKSHQLMELGSELVKAEEKLESKRNTQRLIQITQPSALLKKELEFCQNTVKTEKQSIVKDLLVMNRMFVMLGCQAEDCQQFGLDNSIECFRNIENKLRELSNIADSLTEHINYNCTWPSPVNRSQIDHELVQKRQQQQFEEGQPQIQAIIERIEHYNESEKIFTKQTFQEQYTKEVNRMRRTNGIKQKNVNKY